MVDQTDIRNALPDYVIERELGQGGMGIVFLGRHARLDRLVAIKELPPNFASDPEVRDRFSTEARLLASLAHPHIVPIYDYVERDGLCLIVMEQLPGGTVWDRFTSTGLTPPTACAVVIACCAALQHAHSKGVLHLDVKPDNLMFASDEAIKVTDFGISRVISGDRTLGTADGEVLGTPAYMSPEQARGSELTKASDVYSAGIMLYELLSGNLPWAGAETATDLLLQRLREDPRPLVSIAPHVPTELSDVVMKAIEREPEARYTSAEDFGVAVASACADCWGPNWLDFAGVSIIGSERLSIAARTTNRQPAIVDPSMTTTSSTAAAPQTMIGGAVDSESRLAAETTTAGAAAARATGGTSAPAPAPMAPVAPPEFAVMRAAGSAPRVDGANFNDIDRSALVDVSDFMQRPPSPMPLLACAGALLVAAVVAASLLFSVPKVEGSLRPGSVRLGGQDVASGPVTFDLSKDLVIRVRSAPLARLVNTATVKFSVVGLPISKISTDVVNGDGTFKTNIARHVAAGSLTGRVELNRSVPNGATTQVRYGQFPATVSRKWFRTVYGIGSLFVILAGFAYLESALRPLRRGRRRIMSFIGCAISAAVMAAGGMALLSAMGRANPTVSGLVVSLSLVALAGISLGIAARRNALRKGVKRAVRRAQTAFAG